MRLGRFRDAAEHSAAVLALQPNDPTGLSNLVASYRSTERYAEADQSLRKLEDSFHTMRAPVMRPTNWGFSVGTRRPRDNSSRGPAHDGSDDSVQTVYSYAADTEAHYGRVRGFREYSNKTIDAARNAGEQEASALWLTKKARWEAELGYADVARRLIR